VNSVLDPLDGSPLWRERGNLGPQQGERLQLVGGECLELAGVSFELTCGVIDQTWASWSPRYRRRGLLQSPAILKGRVCDAVVIAAAL
jgi:hypothetical protein